ncbi:MAG: hypothetical protein AAGC55_19970, partial [Myxococcota bacterium]
LAVALALLLLLGSGAAGCGDDDSDNGDDETDAATDVEDLDLTADDFECILNWPKVDKFRIINKLGYQSEAEAVANSPTGGTYPVGTIIQLIPQEAMVKRRAGFNPASNDWEFFFLEIADTGTTIATRGTTEVTNGLGGNCLDCHSMARSEFDLICSDANGCEPLPFTAEQIEQAQNADPRCAQGLALTR